jgi:hypothetical protein
LLPTSAPPTPPPRDELDGFPEDVQEFLRRLKMIDPASYSGTLRRLRPQAPETPGTPPSTSTALVPSMPPAISALGGIGVMPPAGNTPLPAPPAPLPPVALNTPPAATPPPPASPGTTPTSQGCPPGEVFLHCTTTDLSSGLELFPACRKAEDAKRQAEQYLNWERGAGRCTMGGAPFAPATGLKSAVLPPDVLPPVVLPPPHVATGPRGPHVDPKPRVKQVKRTPPPPSDRHVNRRNRPRRGEQVDAATGTAVVGIIGAIAGGVAARPRRGGHERARPARPRRMPQH